MEKKPNILVFFTDQQRWDTCGCYNPNLNLTPNLDVLAADGMVFEKTYTCQPVCGPARVAIQTGMYPTAANFFHNCCQIDPKKITSLAEYLNRAGYKTGYIGKTHWSLSTDGPVPKDLRLGYKDYWKAVDVLEFSSLPYEGQLYDENNQRVGFKNRYRPDFLTDLLLEFLDEQNQKERKPFFLMMSLIEPHHQNCMNRYVAPDGYAEKYRDAWVPGDLKCRPGMGDWEENLPDYYGIIKRIDENLGRVVRKLKETNMYDDTVIFFTSDHGSHFRTRNEEYKRSCHEACTRIPFVVHGPGVKQGIKEKDHLFSLLDLPATILDIAGERVPAHYHGRSLMPFLRGDRVHEWRQNVFIQISEAQVGRAVCDGRFKYSVSDPSMNGFRDIKSDHYTEEFLYDLSVDPDENHNLIDDPAYEDICIYMGECLIKNIECFEHYTPEIFHKQQGGIKI
ncbi:MAG: sulfatase-like hydrolase/transferase [Ruminococcus sp.]|jgi:arylsulfatase A-like enzyme